MAKRGKRYTKSAEIVERAKSYEPMEALDLVKRMANAKFDETVEAAVRLGVDPKRGEQMVRGTVVLPHGIGRQRKVAVIAKSERVKEAEEAGADIVGGEELVEKIRGGWKDFDVLVATPDVMSIVGKLGKILGPRMPNPKSGTLTFEVAKAVKDLKGGKIEFRIDKAGIIHSPIGKASFPVEWLLDNFVTLISALMKAKPAAAKSQYFKGIAVSSTMGPGLKMDLQKALAVLEK